MEEKFLQMPNDSAYNPKIQTKSSQIVISF